MIPLHINGTKTISLPLLLFIIHAVGAHRNPSHGALILFVLAEQIHPKRQVTVLKKHFIFSLNRQDSQKVGEEITRRNGLPTVTPLTTDLLRTSSNSLWSPGKEPWSMGMLQGVALPCLLPEHRALAPSPCHRQSPECPYLALIQPLTPQRFLQKSSGFRSFMEPVLAQLWISKRGSPWELLSSSSFPTCHTITVRDSSWDPPQSYCSCCKFAWTVPKIHLFMPVSVA